jgi:hypothetical protein
MLTPQSRLFSDRIEEPLSLQLSARDCVSRIGKGADLKLSEFEDQKQCHWHSSTRPWR